MNEYQLKYEALRMQIDDPEMVEIAERIAKTIADMSCATAISYWDLSNVFLESLRLQALGKSIVHTDQPFDMIARRLEELTGVPWRYDGMESDIDY